MDSQKFARLVREFPFIEKILTELKLESALIGNIEVKRGDRNLLEVTPIAWSHDCCGYGEDCGHRFFWCVAPGEIIRLESAWHRTVPYERNDYEDADTIGDQLLSLDRDVQFLVEVHEAHWDWDEGTKEVIIYKMKSFDWRRFFLSEHRSQ